MDGQAPEPGMLARPDVARLRSGQDWARWLELARPAQPFGTKGRTRLRTAAWTALVQFARREGFCAARGDCAEGDAFTTWHDRRIHVRATAGPGSALAALAHELGHILLHGDHAYLGRSRAVRCAGIRKAEADSVAYLVAVHLGIDTPAITFPPPSRWAGTDPRAHPLAMIQAVSDRVLAAASKITAHVDAALAGCLEPQLPSAATYAAPDQPTIGRPRSRARRRAGRQRPFVQQAGEAIPAAMPRPRRTPRQAPAASEAARGIAINPAEGAPLSAHAELARIHQTAARFFRGRLPGSWVPGYLASRGFPAPAQRRWQAGYAPAGWDTLTRHLRALGYRDRVIEASGLAHRCWRGTLIDTFRDRATLPIRDSHGTVVAFIGRAPPTAAPDVPKYLNSPHTALYDKGGILFGLGEGRKQLAAGARPVLVEGPLDAIAVSAACPRRYAGVAPCGTALTSHHAAALDRVANLRTSGVLVAFDSDPPGRQAAVKAYHLLSQFTGNVGAAILPTGQDPAQILCDHGAAALAATLHDQLQPLADLVIDAAVDGWNRWLRYPEGQINALRSAAPLIAAMPPSQVARQAARLARRLGLDYATVTEAITDALTAAANPHPSAEAGHAAAAGARRPESSHPASRSP